MDTAVKSHGDDHVQSSDDDSGVVAVETESPECGGEGVKSGVG